MFLLLVNRCNTSDKHMSKTSSKSKSVMLATRVTPIINELVVRMSLREGLNKSEWIRNLIIAELKRSDALPVIT